MHSINPNVLQSPTLCLQVSLRPAKSGRGMNVLCSCETV